MNRVIWQMLPGGQCDATTPGISTAPYFNRKDAQDEADESQNEQLRRPLVQQIEQWVNRMLAGEEPPAGLPLELLAEAEAVAADAPSAAAVSADGCDLYTLFSALTTLSGEIRLQGRTFKQVVDALAPLNELPGRLERLEASQQASADELRRLSDQAQRREAEETEGPSAKQVLAVLFDLCDRMDRGIASADAAAASLQSHLGLLARLTGAAKRVGRLIEATTALREGYRMTLSRLQAALHEWGVERISRVGAPFDPQLMTAVDVQISDNGPEGTVLEVYRSGYVLHGQVLALAQVKVAKAPEPAR